MPSIFSSSHLLILLFSPASFLHLHSRSARSRYWHRSRSGDWVPDSRWSTEDHNLGYHSKYSTAVCTDYCTVGTHVYYCGLIWGLGVGDRRKHNWSLVGLKKSISMVNLCIVWIIKKYLLFLALFSGWRTEQIRSIFVRGSCFHMSHDSDSID